MEIVELFRDRAHVLGYPAPGRNARHRVGAEFQDDEARPHLPETFYEYGLVDLGEYVSGASAQSHVVHRDSALPVKHHSVYLGIAHETYRSMFGVPRQIPADQGNVRRCRVECGFQQRIGIALEGHQESLAVLPKQDRNPGYFLHPFLGIVVPRRSEGECRRTGNRTVLRHRAIAPVRSPVRLSDDSETGKVTRGRLDDRDGRDLLDHRQHARA